MNTHKKISELIIGFALQELSEEQSNQVKQHLGQCQQCREELKRLEAVLGCARSMSQFSMDSRSCESAKEAVFAKAKSEQKTTRITRPYNRLEITGRTIMKSPITKLAAAAVIVIAIVLSTTFFDTEATSTYALEQTLKANHTIWTIHLRMFPGEECIENNEYMDCWVQYDDAGSVSNFRWNLYGDVREDDDNLKFTVWNEGILKTWLPLKNVIIVHRVNDAEKYWEDFAEKYDPKLILQRLYDDPEEKEALELKINEPTQHSDPIYVEAINSADSTQLELVVDSETKLVTQLSEYKLGEQQDALVMRIKYLSYNEPIEPSVFKLSGIPDDALVYDQVDQLVGLEQGDLTDEEIAVEVVRECLEATIAQDYDEVSRLMEGDPGDTVEIFIEEELRARLVRIISFGQPELHERWQNILCVPCEIEIEDEEGTKRIANITATAKAIGYQPGRRWIMHTDLEADALDRIVKGIIALGVKVGEYTFDMSKEDVLERLGKPRGIFYGQEKYSLNNLPQRYYMVFGDLSFRIVDDSIKEIGVHRPCYKFTNGLGVGDSEQSIKEAFGNDFRIKETEWKDFLIYEGKGLQFEIHKENRTVLEFSVFPAEPKVTE